MASQGAGVPASDGMEVTGEDLEKPSPSQSLLQRLKSLREWQERQRDELMQVLAHTNPSLRPSLTLTPLREETPAALCESVVVVEDSTPPHLVPHLREDHATVGGPGVEAASPVVHTPQPSPPPVSPETFPAEAEEQPRQSQVSEQLPGSHDGGLYLMAARTRPAHPHTHVRETSEWDAPPPTPGGANMGHDPPHPRHCDLEEGDQTSVREVEYDPPAAHPQEGGQDWAEASPPHQDPSDFMDHSTEDLFGLEQQKPYRSEKYESRPAPGREGLAKGGTQASQAVKNLAPGPSKSFFCTMNQGEAEAEGQAPRPKHKFLRKGEGTCRFGMRPMRLKKASKTETVSESSLPPHEAVQNSAEVPHRASPPAPAPTKRQVRLPMRSLKLQEAPQKMATSVVQVSSVGQAARVAAGHRASPPPPPAVTTTTTTTTTRGPTTPLPRPLDLEKQRRKEEEELSAFEKLEELAEDSSFSSNSSTVWRLLKQGQQSASSTPMRTTPPPPLALQETPVLGSCGMAPKTLGAEPHFLGDLINRVLPVRNGTYPHQQQQQQQQVVAVDVKEVLAQLEAIVRLEGHSISDITESDIQSFLEGCSSQPSYATHPTSTPAPPQSPPAPQARPHHVHFASEGVQVMEYELSDGEGDDTLTEAASLDSDLITTSDLEALTHLSMKGSLGPPQWQQQQQTELSREGQEGDSSSSSEVTLTEQPDTAGQEPVVLTFSPPPPRPVNSASNYIWSIFGKDRDARKQPAPKAPPKQAMKEAQPKPPHKQQQTERQSVAGVAQSGPERKAIEELEVHKTLLLAKVTELEKETNLFKKENTKLKRLQQETHEERQKLEEERHRLQEEAAAERRKFREYVDRERNALWRDKQQQQEEALQRPAMVTLPQEHVMEAVRLKEQVRVLREEAERKESLHQFALKKFNDRIKALENENKKLKEKNNLLQDLEKENQDLRLKMDRARAGGRVRAATQSSKPTRGRPKSGTRCTTVDGAAKTLDKMTKPQPVKAAAAAASKTKQDVANNNVNLASGESEEDVMAGQGSSAKAGPPQVPGPSLKDTQSTGDSPSSAPAAPPRPRQPLAPVWGSLGCTEEAGLDHTERLREDGIQEVIYANGNRKEIHPSGDVMISFYNGDRKEIRGDRTVYVYGSDNTSHTTYTSGREELVFPSGQRETRHPDGSSEISFSNGSRKTVLSDGTEICTTKDGSVVRTNTDGSQVFEFPSGQREVHRGGEKRREYPDGTVKILHPDGRAETRYSSGRIRIKDREGNVVLDTHTALASPSPS